MPSYVTPKKNTTYIFYIGLVDSTNRPQFVANPTIATGDFQVSIDGGSLSNLTSNPTVVGTSKLVQISLTAAEMNGDNIAVVGSDAAGAEWDDVIVNIQTTAQQIDDLSTFDSAVDNVTVGDLVAAAANKVADHTLRRAFASAADSADGDTKSFRSLLGAVAKLVNRITVNAGSLVIYEEDDTTVIGSQSVTTTPGLDPISDLDTT